MALHRRVEEPPEEAALGRHHPAHRSGSLTSGRLAAGHRDAAPNPALRPPSGGRGAPRARSRAGRCRSSTRGSGRSTSPCAPMPASSTSRTWARSRRAARTPSASCSASCRTTSRRSRSGGAQYSVLCREDGGVLDDLFTYRLGDDRYLTVTNAANHERDFAWLAEHARRLRRRGPRRRGRLRDDRPPGPARARECSTGTSRARRPRACAWSSARVAGVDCLVCGTGYTGEDGVELLIPPDGAAAVWDALDVTPVGLGARDTLRLEVCFHLYGNDLSEDRNPIEAGLGWCCKLDTGFIGADALRRLRAGRDARAVRLHRPGHPAAGQSRPGGRRARAASSRAAATRPASSSASGWRTFPWTPPRPGTHVEVDVRGKRRRAEIREKPLYKKEDG